MQTTKRYFGLVRTRQVLLPTWRGWLVLAVLSLALCFLLIRSAYPFLAVNKPIAGGLLVVEGWSSDYVLKAVVREYEHSKFEQVVVTGGPIDYGAPLMEYKTYAERGAAILCRLGMRSNVVAAAPAPYVRQDRTYVSAVALGEWLNGRGMHPRAINLVTTGPHARRSRLLFKRALGMEMEIGITAVRPEEYDPARWWRFSSGVRGVSGELLAYLYARFIFEPAVRSEEKR